MKGKQKPKSPLAVLMFLAAATSERGISLPFHDPFAPGMIRWTDGRYAAGKLAWLHSELRKSTERSDPGAYGYMLARALWMDEVVKKEVEAGIDHLVLLGAGYDTRAYRMRQQLRDVAIFEVDLPLVSRDKRARVKKAVGAVPDYVSYVEVDFNKEDWLTRLADRGHSMGARTLFVLSGVSMYLPEGVVLETLARVGAHESERTSIVFDYFFADLLERPQGYYGGQEWISRVTGYGEEPRYAVEFDDIGNVVQGQGLSLESHRHIDDIAKSYLCREDGTLAGRPYGFAALAHAFARKPTGSDRRTAGNGGGFQLR